jgi:hypothetical protein
MQNYDPKMWWSMDIDLYMKLVALENKYPNNENIKARRIAKRESMCERYGNTAMKGI